MTWVLVHGERGVRDREVQGREERRTRVQYRDYRRSGYGLVLMGAITSAACGVRLCRRTGTVSCLYPSADWFTRSPGSVGRGAQAAAMMCAVLQGVASGYMGAVPGAAIRLRG